MVRASSFSAISYVDSQVVDQLLILFQTWDPIYEERFSQLQRLAKISECKIAEAQRNLTAVTYKKLGLTLFAL